MRRKNGMVAVVLAGVAAGMVGLAFAAVPLYQLFCQVTGYGGTTQTARDAPGRVTARDAPGRITARDAPGRITARDAPGRAVEITVRFNADTAAGLAWGFEPASAPMALALGEQGLAFYRVRNNSRRPITGVATYNVTPQKAGLYFTKLECFCFTEQTLMPGETAEMPVAFYIDPEIARDPSTRDIKTITLSYTFFEARRRDRAGAVRVSRLDAATARDSGNNGDLP